MPAGCICGSGGWIRIPAPGVSPETASGLQLDAGLDAVASEAGNTSNLDEHRLAFINLVGGSQSLADGQRVQYRFDAPRGAPAGAYVTALEGDPDLYAWMQRRSGERAVTLHGTGVTLEGAVRWDTDSKVGKCAYIILDVNPEQ